MTTQTSSHLPERPSQLELEIANILRTLASRSQRDLTDSRCRWLPRGQIFEVISTIAVRALLQSRPGLHEERQPASEELVNSICPPINNCRCGSRHCTGGRIIFAACLSLSKPDLIDTIFLKSKEIVCDAHLARLDPETNNRSYLASLLEGELSSAEIHRFVHFTWQMRSPVLERLASQDPDVVKPGMLEVPENASLPWIDMGDAKDTHEEVNSVQRIVIHPDHSGSETLQGDLALKIFKDSKPRAKKSYKKEVEANRRTPEHERIVPLLAAFEHREDFHVVLPWARGGNLAVFFQKYAAPKAPSKSGQVVVDWATEDWLLAECLGLADGLAAVHGASTSAQIHADIKPENILCFASGDGDLGPFTLKLADFGESLEVDQRTKTIKTESVPHTKTYRPPEHDTADILDLKYDVWCLGCVFFEFVTWAIAGTEKIDTFSDERLAEHDEKKVTTAMGEVGADTFFRKIAGRPSSRVLSPTNVKYERVTIDKKKLSRSYFRRQYRWWLNYTGTVKALVKTEFTRHVAWLKEQGASEKLEKFLVFIETRMLVVDTKDRADSAEVYKFLGKLCSGPHAQSNGAIT